MCRSQLVHKSVSELLGCVCGEFQGRETCTVSIALISKQQAPMIQGNVATHITMGILAIGKFVMMNVWGKKKSSTMLKVSSLSHPLPKELKQPELLSALVTKPKQAGSLNLPAAPTEMESDLQLTLIRLTNCSQAVFGLAVNRTLLAFYA